MIINHWVLGVHYFQTNPFLKAYIDNIRKLGVHLEFFAYGPTMRSNMVKEIQNGRASLSYKFHLVPTCFFEGASHVHYFHGPDEEIPGIPGPDFSGQILQILIGLECGFLHRSIKKEPFDLWISLAQPVGQADCRHFGSSCCRETIWQTAEHQVALNPKH